MITLSVNLNRGTLIYKNFLSVRNSLCVANKAFSFGCFHRLKKNAHKEENQHIQAKEICIFNMRHLYPLWCTLLKKCLLRMPFLIHKILLKTKQKNIQQLLLSTSLQPPKDCFKHKLGVSIRKLNHIYMIFYL